MGACHKRDAHDGQELSELLALRKKASNDNGHAGLASKSLHLGTSDKQPELSQVCCLVSNGDRTALRHRSQRSASQMVSQCWAWNPGAWAARATSLPPAQRSTKEKPDVPPKRSKFPKLATTSEANTESKSRKVRRVRCRVMTSGARTVPLSPGAANKWLPCNPTQKCCGAGWVRVSAPASFASDVQPNEQHAHILVQRGVRQLKYRAFFVWARSENSFSLD